MELERNVSDRASSLAMKKRKKKERTKKRRPSVPKRLGLWRLIGEVLARKRNRIQVRYTGR